VCIVPCSSFPRLENCDNVFFSGISDSLQPRVIANTYNAIKNSQKIDLCKPKKSTAMVKADMTPNLVLAAMADYRLFLSICKNICKKRSQIPFQRVIVPKKKLNSVVLTKKGLISVNGGVSTIINPNTGKPVPTPISGHSTPVPLPVPKRMIR